MTLSVTSNTSNPSQTPCKYYMAGHCGKGSSCDYKHPSDCKFFNTPAGCPKGKDCNYYHANHNNAGNNGVRPPRPTTTGTTTSTTHAPTPNHVINSTHSTKVVSKEEHTTRIAQGTERQLYDVIFSIDTSGSMAGSSLKAAIEALLEFHSFLDKKDRVSLTTFASEVKDLSEHIMTKAKHPDFKTLTSQMSANGSTKLYDAMIHGMNKAIASFHWNMKKAKEVPTFSPRVPRLVVLTDGEDVSSTHTLNDVYNLIHKPGIPSIKVYVIAVGSAIGTPAMKKLAELKEVEVVEAKDSGSILEAFRKIRTRMIEVKEVVTILRKREIILPNGMKQVVMESVDGGKKNSRDHQSSNNNNHHQHHHHHPNSKK